jgi:hypothetical protein
VFQLTAICEISGSVSSQHSTCKKHSLKVAFINYYIVPMYFAQLWSIMLVHRIFICCQKNIKFLVNHPFPKI